MKILAMFSSPRPNSNSTFLLETILKEAEKNGHDVNRLDIVPLNIKPCTGCRACWTNKTKACIIEDDYPIVAKAIEDADYILMSTPVYNWWVSASLKAALDRSYPPPYEKFHGKTMHLVMTGEEQIDNLCFTLTRDGFTALFKYMGVAFKYFFVSAGSFDNKAQDNAEAISQAKEIGASL